MGGDSHSIFLICKDNSISFSSFFPFCNCYRASTIPFIHMSSTGEMSKTFQLFIEGDQHTNAQLSFHMNFNVALVLGKEFFQVIYNSYPE